jgi:hypothetical protein
VPKRPFRVPKNKVNGTENPEKRIAPFHLRSLETGPSWIFGSLKLPAWCDAKLLFSSEHRHVFGLELDFHEKNRKLKDLQETESKAIAESLKIEAELTSTRTELIPFDHDDIGKLSNKAKRKLARKLTPQKIEKIKKLQLLREDHERKLKVIQEKRAAAEFLLHAASTRMQLAMGQLKNKTALAFFNGSSMQKARNRIQQMELDVEKKERAAIKSFEKLERDAKLRVEARVSDSAVLVEQTKLLAAKPVLKRSFPGFFADLRSNIDPSVERAYKRIHNQILLSQKLATKSQEMEATLQTELEVYEAKANQLLQRVLFDRAQNKPDSLVQKSKEKSDAAQHTAIQFASALNAHKTKNLAITQTMFRVEGIARRLFYVKSLLLALPEDRKSKLETYDFMQLAQDLCRYLQCSVQKTGATDSELAGNTFNFDERIHELEQGTLVLYLRFAKGDLENENQNVLQVFVEKLESISVTLNQDLSQARQELDRWRAVATNAVENKMDLLLAVALQRLEHYERVIKMAEQSIDVLSVTSQRISDKVT